MYLPHPNAFYHVCPLLRVNFYCFKTHSSLSPVSYFSPSSHIAPFIHIFYFSRWGNNCMIKGKENRIRSSRKRVLQTVTPEPGASEIMPARGSPGHQNRDSIKAPGFGRADWCPDEPISGRGCAPAGEGQDYRADGVKGKGAGVPGKVSRALLHPPSHY